MVELTLQFACIVLAFFLINNCVCGTSENLLIYRGDRDTFTKPSCSNHGSNECKNCTDMNANCSDVKCHECTCSDQYKTYLENSRKCVRDEILLFFPGEFV